MSKRTDAIKKLYIDSSISERDEVRKWIAEYESASLDKRTSMRETFNKSLSLGPISAATCALCGK